MDRGSKTDWIRIRQRRVIDGQDYYADRLYETQQAAWTYARQLETRGATDVRVLRTATEGGYHGYAAFVKRDR
ncbi:MAG TPA: hypothetical protein PK196_00570 [Methanoculleus sp.]|jgi:hypothetical protein|nr:hypothetical protein [Methanoculleus sp.]MBP8675603.1 hypothetical protein [Methanoculleus sp.]HOB06709.1 hypothetical protein [Methanoculleus sp.]HON39950.1 hypothetical protein [Methanoculleus sp.]HPD51025.1 hypothetical protein [Methanoculleus sp.]